jgi:hypothetical protein
MTKKEKGKKLEELVLAYFKSIDPKSRLSRASGATNDIGDVVTDKFFIECKNWNKENVILKMSTWKHLLNQMPINTTKIALFIFQNNQNKQFVVLELEDFYRIIKNANL